MRKRMKVITFALVLAVCFIPSMIYAADETVTVKNPFSSMSITADAGTLSDANGKQAATNPQKELTINVNVSYTQADKIEDYYAGKIIPIKVSSSGILRIEASAVSMTENIDMGIYSDAACTNRVGYLDDITSAGSSIITQDAVPSAGTFYLKLYNWYAPSDEHAFQHVVALKVSFYSNTGITLKSGKLYKLGNNEGDVYHKLTMPYKGYLTITGDEETNFSITNAKKTVIKDYQRIDEDYDKKCTYRLAKGTYYFKPGSYSGGDDDIYSVKYTTTKADPVLKRGVSKTFYPGDSKEVTYLKVVPSVTGYITASIQSSNVFDQSGYIALCNAKKSMLTNDEWFYGASSSSNTQVYAVQKGKTYYLKMTDFAGKAKVKFTQTKITEKSGATKKKAVAVKQNKKIKGTILAGEKKADWYKITLKKNKTLHVYTDGRAQGTIKMTVYNKAGKKMTQNNILYGDTGYDLESFSKYKKGTYYLKIERVNNKSNGYYTIKWN